MDLQSEIIVIGGGHNGLVAAATLAKAGRQVLLLEKRAVLGGAAATEELFPGFRVSTGATDAGIFQEEIVQALDLPAHGLRFLESPVALFAPQPDGQALTLYPDPARSAAGLAPFSQKDAGRYLAFSRQVEESAAVLQSTFLLPPPDLMERHLGELLPWGKVGLKLRRLGRQKMMEFLRILPLPARDYLDEWFESEALKGALGADAIAGMAQGPRSAGTTFMFFYQNACGFLRRRTVAGGTGQLSAALAAAARQHGAEIRTGAAVQRLLIDDDRVTGVLLEDGQKLRAGAIFSSLDPRRTFFGLAGAPNLGPRFMRQVRNILFRGTTARLNLALNALPSFRGQSDPAQLSGRILISPSLDYLERAFDDSKYGRISRQPFLEIRIPTVTDPGLAPAGHHIITITMKYAPYHLAQGDWAGQRQALRDHILDTLAPYAPDLGGTIVGEQLLTPLDWEEEYGLSEGSIFHGQMVLDQLLFMRPVPGWGQYATPIANLHLCGAGAHPGGGVSGAPGYNAARHWLQGR